MLRKTTTIVLLNQTNEELILHENSPTFTKCHLIPHETPPKSVLAGEYGSWVVTATGLFKHMKSGLSYGICGTTPEQTIHFYWQNSIFGSTSYHGTQAPEGYCIKVLGGQGLHSTLVFIFGAY
jgi:hypothetical protein